MREYHKPVEFEQGLLGFNLEKPKYLTNQLITYLGNKRSLIRGIEAQVMHIRDQLGGRRLRSCDVFAGSGVVSRMLKQHSELIISNDIEDYAACIGRAFLTNESEVDWAHLREIVSRLNEIVISGGGPRGFIQEMYAPRDDKDIKLGERVFYTSENARRLDAFAQLIRLEPEEFHDLLLGPLLSKASIHNNTGGVFKGFYKDSETGIGRFGGSGADALSRITAPISLEVPILSNFDSKAVIHSMDAAALPSELEELDFVYLDPPYNQHPYGSNYFMLNLLIDYRKPLEVSAVSGIPTDWQRSAYNKKKESFSALKALVDALPARFVMLSFSDDGFLDPDELQDYFHAIGKAEAFDIEYNTYRASRNLANRSKKITEHLFLVDRG